jgi:hypothetical protein
MLPVPTATQKTNLEHCIRAVSIHSASSIESKRYQHVCDHGEVALWNLRSIVARATQKRSGGGFRSETHQYQIEKYK